VTVRTERSQAPLGKKSNAAVFLNSHRRKSEVERPLCPTQTTHVWVTTPTHRFLLEGTPKGWRAITAEGEFVNPWTKLPFSSQASAAHAVKRRLLKGRWPGRIGQPSRQRKISPEAKCP